MLLNVTLELPLWDSTVAGMPELVEQVPVATPGVVAAFVCG